MFSKSTTFRSFVKSLRENSLYEGHGFSLAVTNKADEGFSTPEVRFSTSLRVEVFPQPIQPVNRVRAQYRQQRIQQEPKTEVRMRDVVRQWENEKRQQEKHGCGFGPSPQ